MHSLAKGICDRCGFEFPLNQLRKEWTGLKVCQADYDRRHPQEFVRGVPDNQVLHDPRPEPADVFMPMPLNFIDMGASQYMALLEEDDD